MIDINPKTNKETFNQQHFNEKLQTALGEISNLYHRIYAYHPSCNKGFDELIVTIKNAYNNRPTDLLKLDDEKLNNEIKPWFLSNQLSGMSLYVDRFCGDIKTLINKLDYFEKLGVNFLHLMPIFESPLNESDGGYAVSNFRVIDKRFGNINDLIELQAAMQKRNMYLMLDCVLNHTSHHHEWALKAKEGDRFYQDYYYLLNDRKEVDEYEKNMPEIFPEAAPGSFTFIKECNKWVMSVFHTYQWDLNYTNPYVFNQMLDTIFFYANLGVDVLRIDAPAFIWKQKGTNCQNLPEAHTLLQLIKQCVQVATPGMALLGEAIVAPHEIMKYFGEGNHATKECDFAYNATHMALQWDALATGNTLVLLAAQNQISKKPFGTSWINYTRCHDDIGLAYDDYMIEQAGFNPWEHRKYLKDYYSGNYSGSPAKGALFSVNEKTGDARISGSLASLCGLEKALETNNEADIKTSIQKIILMQAHSFLQGGVPVLFYGDESGHINDYSYLNDQGKHYDNRWMHRPVINWKKKQKIEIEGSVENQIFTATQNLINIRKTISVLADKKNMTWLTPHNIHVAGFLRAWDNQRVYCLFNFSNKTQHLTWYAFKEHALTPKNLYDYWSKQTFKVGNDNEYLVLQPYSFYILEPK